MLSKTLKVTPHPNKLPALVKDLGVKVPDPVLAGPGSWKFPPINPDHGHQHDHHGHHDHQGHHHHGHHHHHKPWFVISWTPSFYVPPVCPCPEAPDVLCPPPALICPAPVDVPVVDSGETPLPAEGESLANEPAAQPAADSPATEESEADAAALAAAEKTEEAKQSADIDLQVEYVQLVEAGNPEKELGPLYRVWIVNNGGAAISKPFDVVLVATNEDAPSQESPYSAERVSQIAGGQRLSVEIRLPVEVLQLSVDAEGLPVPFKNLFAATDVQQELAELNEQNNALGLARTNVPDASMVAAVD